jgi:hypothetical protein
MLSLLLGTVVGVRKALRLSRWAWWRWWAFGGGAACPAQLGRRDAG